jgi:hypothetical protein
MRELYGTFDDHSRREGDAGDDFADTQSAAEFVMAAEFVDSVHLPEMPGEPPDEKIVRPSLAILFRMAVGPDADYYAPRFLEYERTGRSFPSWNWSAFMAPGVWAIYRRLWTAGIAFTVWPFLGLALCWFALPSLGDLGIMGIALAAIIVWFSPGVVGALVANSLLHRQARELVADAEALTSRTDRAARWLSRRTVIAPFQAAAATVIMLVALGAVVPNLRSAYADQLVRARIAESIVAIQPLQRQLEQWFVSRSPSDAPTIALAETPGDGPSLEKVNVSVANGRVRLALDSSIPELSGRSILFAPAIDRRSQVRWICIPVDIPARYLPQECKQG